MSLALIRESICQRCPAPCDARKAGTLDLAIPNATCPLDRWKPANWRKQQPKPKPRLGDRIEKLVKPIAKALKLPCLDKEGNLKPQTPCAKKRDWLNKLSS